MNKNLHPHDAQAVDLLLQHGNDGGRRMSQAAIVGNDTAVSRVAVVESVLRIFGETPAADPPRDLLERTLLRINVGVLTQQAMPDMQADFNS